MRVATIRKRNGQWQVQVRRRGFDPVSKTFTARQDAAGWARQIEAEMDRNAYVPRKAAEAITVKALTDRYLQEVAPQKRSHRAMRYDLLALGRHFRHRTLATLTPADVAGFRDARLASGCAGATVRKQLNVLARVIDTARREWGVHAPTNPARMVSRPTPAPGRSRRVTAAEELVLLDACRTSRASNLDAIVILAIETAMRLGELLALEWADVRLDRRTVHLRTTKNGEPRTVPLSNRAADVLATLNAEGAGKVFPNWKDTLSFEHAWHRAVVKSGLPDLHFHDLRHEATTRVFERGLNPMQVAAITGHKTLQMLKRYTHLRAEDLVPLLK
jgi:integrase